MAALYLTAMAGIAWQGLQDRPGVADVALVLGTGGVEPDDTPSPRLRARLDRAVELDREHPLPTMLVSGGGHETEVMADYLARHGIAREHITLDPAGWTTYDSAQHTAAFLQAHGGHGVVIVTQYFHVPRARFALERFGVAPVFSAHAHRFEPHDLYSLAREVAAWIAYAFKPYPG